MTQRPAGPDPETAQDALHEVRERAERRLVERVRAGAETLGAHDVERLVHEPGVHQVEIEIQNEELRRAQRKLEASRDRYRALYEDAPVAYFTTSLIGQIIEANAMACQLAGVARRNLLGRMLGDFIAPGFRDTFQRACLALLDGGTTASLELRLELRGVPRWVAVSVARTLGPEDPHQLRVTMVDQTERVELHEARANLAAIVSSSDDAIIGRDIGGRVITWNGGAERLLGVTADQAIGRPLDAVLPADRVAEDREMVRQVLQGERIAPFEIDYRDNAGHPVPLLVSASPILDQQARVTGISIVGRDITERKRNERALLLRLRQLDVLAQAGQALIMAEPDAAPLERGLFDRVRLAIGGEVYLHYAVADNATLNLVSSCGLPESTAAAMRTAPIDRSLCGLAAARRVPLIVEALQETDLAEAAQLKAAGVRCYAGFPLLGHDVVRGVAAFASTSRDYFREGDLQVMQTVCDQVAAMQERVDLLAELHEREQALRAADRRKDDFIATLAHELRNPLAPIRNAVGILARSTLADPQMARCRDVIERQVRQMTRLLEDLLDVSRVTRNKIELRRERVELRQIVDDAVEATRPLLEALRHRFELDLPAAPILLYGDATRLTQVLGNLLNNAAKYTDAGGQIELRARAEGDDVVIAVRDNGIGMDPRQANQVFDMFAQLAPAIERSRGGLGIGLALSRGLIELHGGRIEACSDGPGTGSEFVVRLPILHQAREPVAPARGMDERALADLRKRRVLVVDDNTDAAQTLGTMLGLHGIDVRVAFSGKEALQVAQAWRADAAVVDIGMPDLNGYELCRRLREQTWGESMLIIACTGWGQAEDRARARAAGFDVHLVKPIDPDDVLGAIARGRVPRAF